MLGRDVRAGSGRAGVLFTTLLVFWVFWSLHSASENGEGGTTLSLVHAYSRGGTGDFRVGGLMFCR
jgi:hypothetical protein